MCGTQSISFDEMLLRRMLFKPDSATSPPLSPLGAHGVADMSPEFTEGLAGSSRGEVVDMIITNETEYYAWNTQWNGVKRPSEGVQTDTGAFAVVNLLGARDETQQGRIEGWRHFSYVQLRIQFVTGEIGRAHV